MFSAVSWENEAFGHPGNVCVTGFTQELGPVFWTPQSPVLSPLLALLSCPLSPIVYPLNASGEMFEVILYCLVLSQILGHSDLPLGMRR